MQKGDSVKVFNRSTGRELGSGKVGSVRRRDDGSEFFSVWHDGGAVTMVNGASDPFFRVEQLQG